MSVVITASGNHGPFKNIEVLDDRLRCDDTDLPFTVIGSYTLSEDDSLIPVVAPAVQVPQFVAMWQARAILIKEGLLGPINAYFAAIPNQIAREQAIAKFEYSSTVQRNDPLVTQLIPALGKSEAQIDAMFIEAAAL